MKGFRNIASFREGLIGFARNPASAARPRFPVRALLVALALAGCAVRPVALPEPIPPDQVRELLAGVESRAGARGLRGLARVRDAVGGKTFGTTQILLAAVPDRFRTEVLSPFGQPLLLLATSGGRVEIFDPRSGEFFSGGVDGGRWQSFTGLPLGPDQVVPLLLYRIPLIEDDDPSGEWIPGRGYRIRLDAGEGRAQLLQFDLLRRLVASTWLREGGAELAVEYGDFSQADGFPRSLRLLLPASEESVGIEFSDLEVDPELSPDVFSLPPPAGVVIRPLPMP